ncbi:caspase recruitment domain-containing protein 8-like [Sardina pilchardus]|uniref:caspase recruitment domain-containing protein 8-like n=1 Tax=Sardina pilchardus TaxID=27697 RepID=UPI002E1358FC
MVLQVKVEMFLILKVENAKEMFSCSTEGVYQCRYTGLIFKTATAAEVQYHTVPWDYKKLEQEGLVAAGPLFKMKGLQGTVRQLGFPHCQIISSEETPSLIVIHIKDKTFEKLQAVRTSDTHVFLNINGFCKFGLAKEQHSEGNGHSRIRALVLLFLDHLTLNVLLLPKNVVLREVFENRRKMTEPRNEIYIDTPSKCKLVPDETYSLTCSSEKHTVTPKIAEFDVESYEDYYPTFQVALSNIEPINLYLHEKKQNEKENGTECVWQTYVNLQRSHKGGTIAESSPLSPYTPPGQDFFHRHKAELETRLGLLRPILSGLQKCRVLNPQEREEVENKDGSVRNRTLLLMLEKKGGPAQEDFYRVLQQCDPYLVKDLERPHVYGTSEHPNLLRRDLNSHSRKRQWHINDAIDVT